MQESIRVYAADECIRADHVLTLWGTTFLRLHYRLRTADRVSVGVQADSQPDSFS
jgi:hypothetical protein